MESGSGYEKLSTDQPEQYAAQGTYAAAPSGYAPNVDSTQQHQGFQPAPVYQPAAGYQQQPQPMVQGAHSMQVPHQGGVVTAPPTGFITPTANGPMIVPFGPMPVSLQCGWCGYQGPTTITKQEGSGHSTCCCLSWLVLAGLGVSFGLSSRALTRNPHAKHPQPVASLGGGLIGICIFYLACSEDYKDSCHHCARCGNVVGIYEKKAC